MRSWGAIISPMMSSPELRRCEAAAGGHGDAGGFLSFLLQSGPQDAKRVSGSFLRTCGLFPLAGVIGGRTIAKAFSINTWTRQQVWMVSVPAHVSAHVI